MIKFEVAKGYEDKNIALPARKTADSAGYDFEVAEDTLIPPYNYLMNEIVTYIGLDKINDPVTLDEMAKITKAAYAKPTLVPTGIKARMPHDMYLELSVRSSCPLKYWLLLANSEGIIDADYYNNSQNDGHIYFQVINLSPVPIILKKGDIIGQGIFKHYDITTDDNASGTREGGFGSTSK